MPTLPRLPLALAVAVLVTGCGDAARRPPSPTPTKTAAPEEVTRRPPSDAAQLADLLSARARALERGDTQAFAATATGVQVARDRRAIRAARALPLDSVRLAVKRRDLRGERATLRVELTYRFDGVDTWYSKTSRMSLRRTRAGWRVASDRPAAGALAPWELRTYRARTSAHFLALAPKSLDVGALMTDLEQGYARMRRGLPGIRAPGRVLVIVARNGEDTRALTKDIGTLPALTAVAETQFSVQGPAQRVAEVWGQRVFVLWPAYGQRSTEQRRTVITHELVHVALARRTSARTPPWLYEGIAMYVSGDNRAGDAGAIISGRGVLDDTSKTGAVRRTMSLAWLSNDDALQRLSAVPLSFAYAYSSAAAFTIAERYGRAGLLRLLSAFNSEKLRGRAGRRLTDRAVRRALKISLRELEGEIDRYAAARSRF